MARKPRWELLSCEHGLMQVRLFSWRYFHDYIVQEMLDYSHFVWRGQRDSEWSLETSLDRLLIKKSIPLTPAVLKKHLNKFQYAARGRRGENPVRIDDENEWWALGQHYGLATPLLDWTESPFVSLYFAFEEDLIPESQYRAVWALGGMSKKNAEIKSSYKGSDGAPPVLEMFKPHLDENYRLVNQAGLFSRAPLGKTVDSWVLENYKDVDDAGYLIKLLIPAGDRDECLRTLNKMNINHITLFPDLQGASLHCNKSMQINKY